MTARSELLAAQDELTRAVLDMLIAERMVYLDAEAMVAVKKAEDRVRLAAKDVTNAVDELRPVERPKGWALDPSGETA